MHARLMLPKVFLFVTLISCNAIAGEGADWLSRLRSPEAPVRYLAAYDTAAFPNVSPGSQSWLAGTSDTSEFVRAHTYAMLGELRVATPPARRSLVSALYKEGSRPPAPAAAVALGKLGTVAIPALIDIVRLGPKAPATQGIERGKLFYANCGTSMFVPSFSAALALARIGPAAVRPLVRLLRENKANSKTSKSELPFDRDYAVHPYIELAIGSIGGPALKPMMEELELAKGGYRARLIGVMESTLWKADREYLGAYERLLEQEDTRPYAMRLIASLGPDDALAVVRRFSPPGETTGAIEALRAVEVLTPELEAEALKIAASLPARSAARAHLLETFEFHDKQLWDFSDRTLELLLTSAIETGSDVARVTRNAMVNHGPLPRRLVPRAAALMQPALDTSPESAAQAYSLMAQLDISTLEIRQRIMEIFNDQTRLRALRGKSSGFDNPLPSMASLLASDADDRPSIDALGTLLRQPPAGLRKTDIAQTIGRAGPRAAHLVPDVHAALLQAKDQYEAASFASALARLGPDGVQLLRQRCRDENDLTACGGLAQNADDASLTVLLRAFASARNTEDIGSLARDLIDALGIYNEEEDNGVTPHAMSFNLDMHRADIKAALPVLKQLLGNRDEYPGTQVVKLVAGLKGPALELVPDIVASVAGGNLDRYLLDDVVAPMQALGDPAALALLDVARTERISPNAIRLLSRLALPAGDIAQSLQASLSSADSAKRAAALEVILSIDAPSDLRSKALRAGLDDSSAGIRLRAAERARRDPEFEDKVNNVLANLLHFPDETIRHHAALSLMSGNIVNADTNAILTAVAIDDYLDRWWAVIRKDFYDSHFKTCRSGSSRGLPEFPWPPPKFSDRDIVPHQYLGTDNTSLMQVDARLSGALQAAGFRSGGVFSIPGGYVRVTKLEQTRVDGTPLAGDDRWAPDAVPARDLAEFVGKLFLQSRGYFRFFVFAVTDDFKPPGSATLSLDDARNYYQRGHPQLPAVFKDMPFKGRECYVLIYNFERTDRAIRFLVPSTIDATTQLERSGIWKALLRVTQP